MKSLKQFITELNIDNADNHVVVTVHRPQEDGSLEFVATLQAAGLTADDNVALVTKSGTRVEMQAKDYVSVFTRRRLEYVEFAQVTSIAAPIFGASFFMKPVSYDFRREWDEQSEEAIAQLNRQA